MWQSFRHRLLRLLFPFVDFEDPEISLTRAQTQIDVLATLTRHGEMDGIALQNALVKENVRRGGDDQHPRLAHVFGALAELDRTGNVTSRQRPPETEEEKKTAARGDETTYYSATDKGRGTRTRRLAEKVAKPRGAGAAAPVPVRN